ncbi:hypothetical protein [Devosia sp. 919]|uniref:hypothetical protein n=1 Tax=Devosia sp. 919 TaxID=2726065 RepID=UPI0015582EDA|nr:hypothetical protein [Devosia sp. 919]
MKAIIEESAVHLRQRFRLRSLEWQNATISIVFGLTILFNPTLFDASFRGFVGGPWVWGSGIFALGCVNVAALVINGTVPKPTVCAAHHLRAVAGVSLSYAFHRLLCLGHWHHRYRHLRRLAFYGFFAAAWALLDAVAPEYGQ